MVVLLLMAGCGKFFVSESSGSSGSSGTGNYLYVANATTGSVAGFSLSSSGLAVTSNSPYSLGVAPSSIAATPNGAFTYVASLAGAIYGYSVGTGGALSLLNSGSAVVSQISPNAIAIDPTGKWLVAVDLTPTAYLFSINTSTGLLTSAGNIALDSGSPNAITFTPAGTLAYVSLGTGGVDILTFNASTGALGKSNLILKPKSTNNADYGLAVDPESKYLFVTETGLNGVRVLSIASNGGLTEISGSPYATGLGPVAVLVDSTGSYVYVANRTDGTISAFTLTSSTGALSKISGSPFTTGTNPASLVEDQTDAYLAVANSGGSPDLQVFTIGSGTGALTSLATATTGTDPTGALAVVSAK
ncbi:lactonase family protein [Silvibacterium dinghuense]|uniref:lactonase family protein n=1 Tax=Silvibacterium dinghuense TaxID=1560006 RepID=UPI0013E93031|nr:beta-propeller fold lactonase family protein [Silvibacterium dinghuense]GGH13710.1 hypothetical protein GCM10011586_33770 [Silvibacterium dinghuense]